MPMTVSPGGGYFGFYSNFGDVNRGETITYSSAVASAAAEGVRDVLDLAIPDDLNSPTILAGHPRVLLATGDTSFIEVRMTYDNGYWGDGGPPFYASNFLVELQGPNASEFKANGGGNANISHYVSSDGGQVISISSAIGAIFAGLTRIKIWRAKVFPGDLPPGPFWTSFINSHEIP